MNVSDPELRAMVREAIARLQPVDRPVPTVGPGAPASHPSHVRLLLVTGGDADGACLIEPTVRCNGCGYCQSYGH